MPKIFKLSLFYDQKRLLVASADHLDGYILCGEDGWSIGMVKDTRQFTESFVMGWLLEDKGINLVKVPAHSFEQKANFWGIRQTKNFSGRWRYIDGVSEKTGEVKAYIFQGGEDSDTLEEVMMWMKRWEEEADVEQLEFLGQVLEKQEQTRSELEEIVKMIPKSWVPIEQSSLE